MSVRFRKDRGKYEVSYKLGGRRQRDLLPEGTTKKQAQDYDLQMAMRAAGIVPAYVPCEVGEGLRKYHAEVSIEKDRNTYVNEKRWLRLMGFYFAENRLQYFHEVRLDHLEGLQRWLQEPHHFKYVVKDDDGTERLVEEDFRPLLPQTVNRWFSTYGHLFQKLRQWKRIPHDGDPTEFLAPLKGTEVFRNRWTPKAVRDVYRVIPKWFRPAFRAVYYYGARPSSLERLKWNGVDFEAGLITLDSKKGAKAATKYFDVPLLPPMRRQLLKIRKAWPLCGGNLEVFRNSEGGRLTADRMSKVAAAAIEQCGYDLDFYELKHTLADDLRKAGVAMDQVAELFGHADTRSTRRYSNSLSAAHTARNLQKVRAGAVGQQKT